MGGASGTLEFALDNLLDDEDFAEEICDALDDFNTAIQGIYSAIDAADRNFWRHAGNSALKGIYYGLQDLGSALINMANSLVCVDEHFSSLMNEIQQNIHKVLDRINTLGK